MPKIEIHALLSPIRHSVHMCSPHVTWQCTRHFSASYILSCMLHDGGSCVYERRRWAAGKMSGLSAPSIARFCVFGTSPPSPDDERLLAPRPRTACSIAYGEWATKPQSCFAPFAFNSHHLRSYHLNGDLRIAFRSRAINVVI